ncbi:four helix bundle protein [Pendulispora brunnea]|uniref:Four helix bundle protein n=1 Tax=Pendulispora brunnea TaxID=2905690 RepID=A0ABZ2JY30_9BACT
MRSTSPPDNDYVHALELAIHTMMLLHPTVERIQYWDRDLGDRLRIALGSMALNLIEGNRSKADDRIAHFRMAAASNRESHVALRMAISRRYVPASEVELADVSLERIAPMLHRLGAAH